MIEEVKRVLEEMGFKCYIKEGELVVPLRIDEDFAEFFVDEDGNAIGIFYDAERFLSEELMREILRIPTKFKVSIGIDEEGDLIFDAWHVKIKKMPETALGSFIIFANFVRWLREQSKNGKVEPFRLEEGKR